MKSSLLARAGFDNGWHVQGLHCKQPAHQREEKGTRSGFMGGCVIQLWVGGYLKWSAASLNPSLGGPREILLSISFFTLGSSRKGKLQQCIRCPTCYSLGPLVTCAVPAGESELRYPCEGAIKPFTNNRKWSSWGVGLEDGVCQTSPVFTAAFYIVYVEEGL